MMFVQVLPNEWIRQDYIVAISAVATKVTVGYTDIGSVQTRTHIFDTSEEATEWCRKVVSRMNHVASPQISPQIRGSMPSTQQVW